jgi:hypothetical protein
MMAAQSANGPFKDIQSLAAIVKLVKGDEKDPLEGLRDLLEVKDLLEGDKPEPSGTLDRLLSALLPAAAGALARGAGPRTPKAPPAPLPVYPTGKEPAKALAPVPPAAPGVPLPVYPVGKEPGKPPVLPPSAVVPSQAPEAVAPVAAASEPSASGVTDADETPPAEDGPMMPLDPYIADLAKMIQAGATPETAAEQFFDFAANKGSTALLKVAVEHGDWAGAKRDPRLAAHAAWIDTFHGYLAELIADEEAELAPQHGS